MIQPISFQNNLGQSLPGDLFLPDSIGFFPCVVFAHGLYSNHKSPRNRQIAQALLEKGIASLLFDFSEREKFALKTWLQHTNDLKSALDFLAQRKEIDLEKIGVNGSSTGATAALRLAASDFRVKTLVLRSARVLDVWTEVPKIKIPVFIIVGALDEVKDESLKLFQNLLCPKEFLEIPQAGHLFEEGDTFQKLLDATVSWYVRQLK